MLAIQRPFGGSEMAHPVLVGRAASVSVVGEIAAAGFMALVGGAVWKVCFKHLVHNEAYHHFVLVLCTSMLI